MSHPHTPRPTRPVLVEVCVSSFDDAVAAIDAGADRIELCAALEVGGLTPSFGLIERVVAAVDKPVMVMVRPRVGDFTFSDDDLETMLADIDAARRAGAAGVVFGFLDERGGIDPARTRQCVAAAAGLQTVFHRAIDFAADPVAGVETLAELGVTRVLTSGGARRAIDGVDAIRQMLARTAGRLEVLPGGGVRPTNVRQLIEATGCDQVHLGPAVAKGGVALAARCLADVAMLSRNEHREVDAAAVREVVGEIAAAALQPNRAIPL